LKFGPDHTEKRDYSRMEINATVTYTLQGEDQTHTGECKDLSHTGLFLVSDQSIAKGQILEVTIDSKNGNFEPMKATVEVIRVEPVSDKYSMGCKITKFE